MQKSISTVWSILLQSTLSQRERCTDCLAAKCSHAISIHAPTKGATRLQDFFEILLRYFNPRSHEGSDSCLHIGYLPWDYFNPRSHEGSDPGYAECHWLCTISIHAPTKGATIRIWDKITIQRFQSTLPRRERRTWIHWLWSWSWFQSTLPRRERQCHPRYDKIHNIISIHAPTKGATSSVALWTIRTMYFNPRSHEGSDVTSPSAQLFLLYFNPRSHEGSDDSLYGIFQSRPQFQSTLPRRERHSWKTFLMVSFPFQSTLPRRERLVLLC